MDTTEKLRQITVQIEPELLQALAAERQRCVEQTGLRVSLSQAAAALMRRSLVRELSAG